MAIQSYIHTRNVAYLLLFKLLYLQQTAIRFTQVINNQKILIQVSKIYRELQRCKQLNLLEHQTPRIFTSREVVTMASNTIREPREENLC